MKPATADRGEDEFADFEVSGWTHALGGSVARHPGFWIRAGNLETRALRDRLEDGDVRGPIYVTGLARAGTTVLLEALARQEGVATHRYRDYPMLFTPYWWNRFLDRAVRADRGPVERSHRDGIAVTADSPEAFEEMLWMAFFPSAHDPAANQALTSAVRNAAFERFYRDHIRKLLLLRGGRRYLAKGNYNLTRLEYLLGLFPDARFVVAVRDPVRHVASLMKQHELLCAAERARPRALDYMRRSGHYEFGLDRRPINPGADAETAAVAACWAEGREVEGWARYWAMLYGFVARRLAESAPLRGAVLVERYEDLCASPREILRGVFAHCGLEDADGRSADEGARIRAPEYYRPAFTEEERAVIARHAGATAAAFGYPEASAYAAPVGAS